MLINRDFMMHVFLKFTTMMVAGISFLLLYDMIVFTCFGYTTDSIERMFIVSMGCIASNKTLKYIKGRKNAKMRNL